MYSDHTFCLRLWPDDASIGQYYIKIRHNFVSENNIESHTRKIFLISLNLLATELFLVSVNYK